jgi:tetratricopeptide (TPR) repeat protein
MRRTSLFVCLAVACSFTLSAADSELGGLIDANRWRKARPMAEAAVKANANDADAAYQLARIKMQFNDLDGALPLAEKAAALQPKNASYRVAVAQIVGTQAQRANVFRQVSLGRRVKREAEAALLLDANNLEALDILRQFYAQAPRVIGGDQNQARAMLAKIKSISPADGFLAEAEDAQGAKQTARLPELYRAAVAANPAHADARRALANFLLLPESRNLAEAETHARELVKLAPGRADSYAALAFALAAQKKLADLDSTVSAAEARIPENLFPSYRAGNGLLAADTDLPRAERYFRRYLAQEIELGFPSHAAAHWRLGLVLEKQGRKAEAIAAIKQAISSDPKLEPAKADLKRLQL